MFTNLKPPALACKAPSNYTEVDLLSQIFHLVKHIQINPYPPA